MYHLAKCPVYPSIGWGPKNQNGQAGAIAEANRKPGYSSKPIRQRRPSPACYKAQAPKGYVEIEAHGDDDWELRGDRCYEIKDEFKSRGFKFEGRSKKWVWRGTAAEAVAKLDELLAVGAAVDKCCREMEPALRAKAE